MAPTTVVVVLIGVGCGLWYWRHRVTQTKKAQLMAVIELEYVDLCKKVERKHAREMEDLKRMELSSHYEPYEVNDAQFEMEGRHRRQYEILEGWRQRQFVNRFFYKDRPWLHI